MSGTLKFERVSTSPAGPNSLLGSIHRFFSRSGVGSGICLSNMLDAFGLGAILERSGA